MGGIGSLLAVAAMVSAQGSGANMQETKEQRDQRMGWWREARFGMFIHWGLYSILEGEWNGNPNHGEWIMETAKIPVDEYEKLLGRFNPVKFDAKDWARMAKDAGMQYVVITTKHHEGFALYDSKISDYDVMATPFKRDIMKELAEAVRGEDLVMGWYHSIMDWHHPAYVPARPWNPRQDPSRKNLDEFVPYLHSQVSELLTNYGPIGVMWFDGEWESTWHDGYGRPLDALCRKLQPKVIVNNRVSNNRQGSMESMGDDQRVGDYSTPEQHIPATGIPGVDWETCMTMNDHWGWNRANKNWKSSTQLIRNLVDIVSKGGNYLLNVGPLPDGTFPQESVERLAEIGRWMKVNGEAIYGTTASPFEKLTWGRATTKGSTLYLHVFDWPKDGRLVVPGLGSQVKSARLLGDGVLQTKRAESDWVVTVPASAPNAHASVVALELDGSPIVYAPPKILAPADIYTEAFEVRFERPEGLEVRWGLSPDKLAATGVEAELTGVDTIYAASFFNGKRVSEIVQRTFRKVEPRPGAAAPAREGLQREETSGAFDSVSQMKFTGEAAMAGRLAPVDRENVGLRYRGLVEIPKDGVYRVSLSSDDGSRLTISGETLDNDGLHSVETKSLAIALAKGWHPIEVLWFNRTGGAALSLEIAPVTGAKIPLKFGH